MTTELILALTGILSAIGGGIAFIWNKVEKRFSRIETELEHCRKRETSERQINSVRLAVIELLWQEVERLAPEGSRVLARAKSLLDNLKSAEGDRK